MSATYRFDGKRVLVTGAGKGIGRGLAKKLSECGAEVLALTRTQADLDSLQAEAENIHPVCVHLEDWDATRKAVEDLGPVHLLVNNASINDVQSILEIDKASVDRYMDGYRVYSTPILKYGIYFPETFVNPIKKRVREMSSRWRTVFLVISASDIQREQEFLSRIYKGRCK